MIMQVWRHSDESNPAPEQKKLSYTSGNLIVTNNLTRSKVFRVMYMSHSVVILKEQQSDGGNLGAFDLLMTELHTADVGLVARTVLHFNSLQIFTSS